MKIYLLIHCDEKEIKFIHNQKYLDNYIITDFKNLLENHKVRGSIFDLINGVYNFSKSTFYTALKISSSMAVASFVYIIECEFLPQNIFKVTGANITDITYNYLCPRYENLSLTLLKIEMISCLVAFSYSAIKYFHEK